MHSVSATGVMIIVKKILIVASDMEIGGAERALIGLLDAIDLQRFHVDLFLLRHNGPFLKLIPDGIQLLAENNKYADLGVPIRQVIKKKDYFVAFGRLVGKIKAKRYIQDHHLSNMNSVEIHYSFKYTLKYLPDISDEEYDLALGFTIPYYLVDKKVKAKNKAVWIHTDYSKLDGDRSEELKVWSAYPHIVSISESVTNAFLTVYPTLKDKIVLIPNIISESLIRSQADAFEVSNEMPDEKDTIKLLSVGRFTHAKNFDNVPDICTKLIRLGANVKWYLIGYGNEEILIREKIHEAGMENRVILLGKKDNPIPYLKACDIYVQPSRFEGKAVTVQEAQILHKPVVITNFDTARSQLQDGFDGVIVPLDNEGCAKGLFQLINDKDMQINLIHNCKNTKYSNEKAVERVYALLLNS